MLKLLRQELDSGVDAAAEYMQELYRSTVGKEHCRRQYRRFFDVFFTTGKGRGAAARQRCHAAAYPANGRSKDRPQMPPGGSRARREWRAPFL